MNLKLETRINRSALIEFLHVFWFVFIIYLTILRGRPNLCTNRLRGGVRRQFDFDESETFKHYWHATWRVVVVVSIVNSRRNWIFFSSFLSFSLFFFLSTCTTPTKIVSYRNLMPTPVGRIAARIIVIAYGWDTAVSLCVCPGHWNYFYRNSRPAQFVLRTVHGNTYVYLPRELENVTGRTNRRLLVWERQRSSLFRIDFNTNVAVSK